MNCIASCDEDSLSVANSRSLITCYHCIMLKIILGLAKQPIVDKHNMESLKTIVSAAAPLGKDTEETVRKRLNLDIKQAWGECNVESRQWVNEVENSCCLI